MALPFELLFQLGEHFVTFRDIVAPSNFAKILLILKAKNYIPEFFRPYIPLILKGVFSAFSGTLCLMLISRILTYLMHAKLRYRSVDPNVMVAPRPRPGFLPSSQIAIAPAMPSDYRLYPARSQERAKQLIYENAFIRQDVPNVRFMFDCPGCKQVLDVCTCAAPMDGQTRIQTQTAHLAQNIVKNNRELLNLYQEEEEFPSLEVGQTLTFKHKSNWFGRFMNNYVFDTYQNLQVVSSFYVSDTRPYSDRHIAIGSTKYYVLRFLKPHFEFANTEYCLPFSIHVVDGLNPRDICVAEEHLRLRRRGTFTPEASSVICSQLENGLATPINDPMFLHLKINPLKDARWLLTAFSKDTTAAYEDF